MNFTLPAKFYSSEALFNLGQYGGAMSGYEYLVNKFEYTSFRPLHFTNFLYLYMSSIVIYANKVHSHLRELPENSNYGSVLFFTGETYRYEKNYTDALYYYEQAKNESGYKSVQNRNLVLHR